MVFNKARKVIFVQLKNKKVMAEFAALSTHNGSLDYWITISQCVNMMRTENIIKAGRKEAHHHRHATATIPEVWRQGNRKQRVQV